MKLLQCSHLWCHVSTIYIFITCMIQDSLDQCPIVINADQNPGIDPKCLSMPIIADQFQSIPITPDQCKNISAWSGIDWNLLELICIDQNWLELISIGINAGIFIGIDRNWALIEGVLMIMIRHWDMTSSLVGSILCNDHSYSDTQ